MLYIYCISNISYVFYINSQNGTESQPHPWWQDGTPPPTDHIMKEVIICAMYVQFNLTQKAYHIKKKPHVAPTINRSNRIIQFPKKKVHFELLNLALIMAESWWQRGTLTTNRSPITSYT